MLNFEVPDLYVKNYRNDFKDRHESLFSALEEAEKEHSHMIAKVKIKRPKSAHNYNQRSLTKSYRGKESIFKTPEIPASRFMKRTIHRPPLQGKWTKYTLSDVTDEDMSEGAMKKAAFTLMRKLQEQKRAAELEAEKGIDFKPVFQKPVNKVQESETSSNEKEYNFGQKIVKKKKEKVISQSNATQSNVHLNHLEYGDEDGDEKVDE